MSNVMSVQKFKNKTSRNGFDLSFKNAFTAKVGELLPVMCKECIPGDKFKINTQWFTRTQPVNTAAYTRIKEYYDFFFVPTNLLWNKFNSFVTSMTDNNQHADSIVGSSKLGDQHPYMTVKQVMNYLKGLHDQSGDWKNFFGFNRADLSVKLLSYLDYGTFGYNPETHQCDDYPTNVALSPFPLLAYQKIYQDFYRNSQWEKAYAPSCNIDYVKGTNDLNLPISQLTSTHSENMFDLRYCNWNKDYFMGMQPSAQFGAPASVNIGSEIVNLADTSDWTTHLTSSASDFVADSPVFRMSDNGSVILVNSARSSDWKFDSSSVKSLRTALGLSSVGTLQGGFTILALRQAEAQQKWQEITQSQQQDYKSQIEAHFGVNVSDAYGDRCKYIGGTSSNLDISEVVNTNLSDDNASDIAGKGVGVGNGFIDFDVQTHGFIMCIYHAVPLLDYDITGFAKQNLKTKFIDYAIPEFDKLGAVKVDSYELYPDNANMPSFNLRMGYVPRYADYKTSIDRVHGAFSKSLCSWVAPFSSEYVLNYMNAQGVYEDGVDITYNFFKVPPSVLNPIFPVDVDSTVDTDQLLINCAFDIKAVRNLDYNGLPY